MTVGVCTVVPSYPVQAASGGLCNVYTVQFVPYDPLQAAAGG